MWGCMGAGEFGVLIAERPGMSWETQFQALHQHFFNVGNRTKALLLSTYVKFVNLYPESRDLIGPVFDKYAPSVELELQQRACEYQRLAGAGDDVLEIVLAGASDEGPTNSLTRGQAGSGSEACTDLMPVSLACGCRDAGLGRGQGVGAGGTAAQEAGVGERGPQRGQGGPGHAGEGGSAAAAGHR